MKFLDLFSGISGFRLGMEMGGHECVGHCEIDKFANTSYIAMHNPKESEWYGQDIRTIRADELPSADVWCFGFPCQDISVAGKQLGFKGRRSSLFYAVMRLIEDTEAENKPTYLFIENVKNLLSVNRGFDFLSILIELDKNGYDAEWQVLNSKDYGVPQNRQRVFIIGHLRGRCGGKVFPVPNSSTTANIIQRQQSNTITERYDESTTVGSFIVKSKQYEKVNQVGNIVATGNWNNPQRGRGYSPNGVSPSPNCFGEGGLEPKIVIPVLTPNRAKKRQLGRRFKEPGDPMFTITSQDRHGVAIIEATKIGYAIACAGDSINLEQPSSNTRRGRVGKGIANTLTTSCNQGVFTGIAIRKLTPRECFRLQGFPDDYFDRAKWYTKTECAKLNLRSSKKHADLPLSEKIERMSDSQLYKQAGNSVTVNVIYAIAKRL